MLRSVDNCSLVAPCLMGLILKSVKNETARSNNQTKRSLYGDRQTGIRVGSENMETAPGSYPEGSREKMGLLTVHDHEGREGKRYYLGDGIPTICEVVAGITEGGRK